MSKTELASLAIRILALWLFVQAIASFLMAGIAVSTLLLSRMRPGLVDSDLALIIFGNIQPLVTFLIGIFLWKKAGWIASRIVSRDDGNIAFEAFTAKDLLSVVFAGMGMYVLLFGASRLFASTAGLFRNNMRLADAWANSHWQYEFWFSVFQIGIGAWLMVGARGIARAIRNLQRGTGSAGEDACMPREEMQGSGEVDRMVE